MISLNCLVDANYVVSCIGQANLATLVSRSYRIIVYTNEKPGKEALACDYFEYDKQSSQLNHKSTIDGAGRGF